MRLHCHTQTNNGYCCNHSFEKCTVKNVIMLKKGYTDFPYIHLLSKSKLVKVPRFLVLTCIFKVFLKWADLRVLEAIAFPHDVPFNAATNAKTNVNKYYNCIRNP